MTETKNFKVEFESDDEINLDACGLKRIIEQPGKDNLYSEYDNLRDFFGKLILNMIFHKTKGKETKFLDDTAKEIKSMLINKNLKVKYNTVGEALETFSIIKDDLLRLVTKND